MTDEKLIEDDPVLRRVAAVRPPIPEDDLSSDGCRARLIAARVLVGTSTNSAPELRTARRPRLRRPGFVLPRVGLGLTAVAAVILALVLAGTFSGPDNSGTQPAAAAVIRATVRALNSRGAIFIDNQTYVSGPRVHGHPYTLDQVMETPQGPGAQNILNSTDDPHALTPNEHNPMSAWSYVGGEQAFYIPATNTIYESSIWGPYLHPGKRPGTWVYRSAPGAFISTRPITITAHQRQELLKGRAAILSTGKTIKGKFYFGSPKVQPPDRATDYTYFVRSWIEHHALHYAGVKTVDGRRALEFAGKTTDATAPELHIYVDPKTHLPFEEVDSVGTPRQTVIHISLRRLPITAANKRLLSLRALHPRARIDRNLQDYLKASHNTQIFSG
jgi:hypothetical protein